MSVADEDGVDERRLVGEVAVERRTREVGPLGHGAHRQTADADLADRIMGHLEDPLPRGVRPCRLDVHGVLGGRCSPRQV